MAVSSNCWQPWEARGEGVPTICGRVTRGRQAHPVEGLLLQITVQHRLSWLGMGLSNDPPGHVM